MRGAFQHSHCAGARESARLTDGKQQQDLRCRTEYRIEAPPSPEHDLGSTKQWLLSRVTEATLALVSDTVKSLIMPLQHISVDC
jgi:hypothetical protein